MFWQKTTVKTFEVSPIVKKERQSERVNERSEAENRHEFPITQKCIGIVEGKVEGDENG